MGEGVDCVKEVRTVGADIVVVLAGAVDLHHTPQVHKALVGACEERPRQLVVNLTEVSYMDSSGIGTLVEVFRRVNAYKGGLALCGLNERVRSVFEITKLDKFFKIFATESEAMAE
ncbi:MAG: STAS domain-containing protein [Planctomycetes bacterium]|nr:STAS domain-containing protein [Planctomycetota bacterium]